MGEEHPTKGRGGVRSAVAAFAAVATLLGGGIVAPIALADPSADANTSTSQSANAAQDSKNTDTTAKDSAGTGTQSDAKTITSVADPGLIRAIAGQSGLKLPQTVTATYSDGTTAGVAVIWSGNGYRSDDDLAKLSAGTYEFKGTVDGTDQQPTATLQVAPAANADKKADAKADQQAEGDKAAPQSDSVPEGKTVESIAPYDYGKEAVGITPDFTWQGVTVTYTDGTSDWLYPAWGKIDSSKAGTVTVEGTVDGTDIKAEATIEFVDIASIEKPEAYTLPGQYPDLSNYVTVALTDGTELSRYLSWTWPADTDWSSTKDGQNVTATGTLENSDDKLTTTGTVHVRDVVSYEPVEVRTLKGVAPSMPNTVTAKLSDGKSGDFSVSWADIDPSQYANAGTFTVEGTVNGSDKKATATVTVQDYKPLESVYVSTGIGDSPYLPGKVNVTLDDGTLESYQVSWPSIDESQYTKTGTFIVTGQLVDDNWNDLGIDVTVTVQVLPIREVQTRTDYTIPGLAPDLPSQVQVTFSDGTSSYRDVTWENIDPSQYAEQGEFSVRGTVAYTDIFAVDTIRVVPITKVNDDSTLTTLVGVKKDLSSYVSVTFADGRTSSWNVTWDAVDDAKWNTIGTFDVVGKLDHTDLTTVMHVTVAGLKKTEYSQKTYVGGGFSQPDLELTNGQSLASWNYEATWSPDPYDSELYKKPGEYDFTGAIKGAKLTFTVHLSVLSIKSIKQPDPVTTVTGVAPSLPDYAYIMLSDGSTKSMYISWKAIDPSQYAKPGTFSAEGTIDSIGKGVTVTVTVLDSQKTKEVTVSTLSEFAPTLPYNVKTTLWDGTSRDVQAQWENPDPSSYKAPGSFDVKGYLLGSEIPIVAHVNVYDPADPVVQTVTTTVGVTPQNMSTTYLSVTLTNGDVFQTPYDDPITWAAIDPSQYAKVGSFEVEGTFFAKSIKLYTRVNVGEVYGWANGANPYMTTYVVGSGDFTLPQTLGAFTADGDYASLPVTWDSFDKSLLTKDGATITVNGKSTGSKPLTAKAVISVVGVKSVNEINDVTVIAGTMPTLPSYATGKLSNGDDCNLYVTWDSIKPEQYAKAGSFTVNGKAGVSYSGDKTIPVSIKVNVVNDIASAEDADVWTVPGVKPNLPSEVAVTYPKSVAASIGAFFKAIVRAATGSDDAEATQYLNVTWDDINPDQYAKDGSTFTVEGTIEGSEVKAKATVTVSAIKTVKLPPVTTVARSYPSLPYKVDVVTNDGATRQMSVMWDSIPASSYQEPGSLFTATGNAYMSDSGLSDYSIPVNVTVSVSKVTTVVVSSMDGLVTEAGVRPLLFDNLPVETTSGQVLAAPVSWDNIKPASYANPGTFEVTGHLTAVGGDAVSAAGLETARSLDSRATVDNGTVKVKVTVIAAQDEPQISLVGYTTNTITPSKDFTLPTNVTVLMSDGSMRCAYGCASGQPVTSVNMDGPKVTWDTSKLDLTKPGNYDIVGTVEGTTKKAHYYLTVADAAAGTLTGFEPITKQFAAGTKAKDAAATLPQQVTAKYSDGTTRFVEVAWDLTPLTDDVLNKVGTTIELNGNVDGTTIKAKATIEVVESAAMPQQPADVTVSTPEGVKPTLPKTITLKYANGSATSSAVTWTAFGDNLWADGKGGTTFDVTGITEIGAFTVTAHVTVTKVKKYTFTFDANGGTLADGTGATVVVREGAQLKAPADPVRSGYVFAGWYDAAEGGKKVTLPFTPTGDEYAQTLYAHWTEKPVPAESVSISGDGVKDGKATVAKGKTLTVKATVIPANATDPSVTWTSSDPTVVSVTANADGTATITGVKGGKATVTAATKPLDGVSGDTAKTASIDVTVPASVASIAAKVSKTAYTKGDTFDPSTVTVTATFDDGTSRTLKSDEYTLSDTTLDTVGGKTVTVTYKANPAVTTTFTLTVAQRYWTVTFDSNGGSAVASQQVADDGAAHVAKPVDPTREGFAFTGWTTDKDGKSPYGFDVPVTGDLTLYAQWKDAAAPVISGANNVYVVQNSTFDPLAGVTATDNVDGKVEVKVSGDVDTSAKVGTVFTLTYTATDKAGNTATVTRKVTIIEKTVDVDSSKTTITGEGVKDGKAIVKKGETLAIAASVAPADATNVRVAWSSSDEKVVTVEAGEGWNATVRALRGGKAAVTLKVYQANPVGLTAGKEKLVATKTIEITVPKTAASVEPLADIAVFAGRKPKLPTTATVVYDDGSKESGKAITWDDEQFVDWPKAQIGFSVVLNGTVEGLPVSVKVTVVDDTEAPVFSGVDDKTISVGTAFDPLAGVTAKDNADGDVTANIKVEGTVDTTKAGSYTLTYTVSDSYGNVTTAVRTITVTAEPVKPAPGDNGSGTGSEGQGGDKAPAKKPDALSNTGAVSSVAMIAALLLAGAGLTLKLGDRRNRGRHQR
ncbi:Ig-like domain-containing protein [Bifidobacterium aerophilum]|uniref:DUF5011 domain-containing protein n=1 Tax=Bifidobacterium aerophilum TaxID=1798155 RepID=A0A6N9Z7F0_9BIFI|nr:Ig-like domain-containing protein [Bifidobacterium aerophilum]NEG90063.1 DUF5011 domain-containing protein [Bifidobacterium aerophilum]